jgi:hypothetical protein
VPDLQRIAGYAEAKISGVFVAPYQNLINAYLFQLSPSTHHPFSFTTTYSLTTQKIPSSIPFLTSSLRVFTQSIYVLV